MAASFASWNVSRGRSGQDVYLTIDQQLQNFLYERLKDESAGAAVMDVETGDLLALVSTPGFDPNAFNVGVTPGQWRAVAARRPTSR